MDRANITDYSTRSGMKVSAAFLKLHRDILAGSTDEAISTAYDLYRTSAVMLEELWKQLELEVVYTIGLAEQGALAYIYNLRCISYRAVYAGRGRHAGAELYPGDSVSVRL